MDNVMKKSILSMLVLTALSGCAATPGGPREASVSSLMTAPHLYQGQIDPSSASGPKKLKVGDSYNQLAVFNLRACNLDETECKAGKGKLQSKTTVVGLSKSEAIVRIDLLLDVGHSQTVQDEVSTTTYQLQGAGTLMGQYTKSETISLGYNTNRRFDLPYGVAFNVCVGAGADSAGVEPNACQGLPLR